MTGREAGHHTTREERGRTSMIEQRVIDQIIDRAEIADVVGDFITLHRKGRDFVGLCPFHNDTRPSFHVSVSKNICKCFVCEEGGNPLTFLMKYENLSFVEAIKYLGRKYGIPVEEVELSPDQQRRRSEREQLLAANNFARDAFVTELLEGGEGRRIGLSYFRERGLTDETIKTFQLGYAPESWDFLVQKATTEGISLELLEQLGLISKSRRGEWIDRYRERIIFPIHSTSGNVVGFGGRILRKIENVGKYINSPASEIYDKSRELYGIYFARNEISKKNQCLVVEGYMDVLSMHQCGVRNVVASSGTALTPQQVQLIKRYTPYVTLIFDADNAGQEAAMRGIDVCLERDMRVSVVTLPEGEDPDSYAQAHSLEEVEAYIEEHKVDGIQFKADRLEEQFGSDAQGQAEVVQQLTASIALIPDEIMRGLYINTLSSRVALSSEALQKQVDRQREEARREEMRQAQRERERQEWQQATEEQREGREEASGRPFTNLSTRTQPYAKQAPTQAKGPKIDHPINIYEEHLLATLLKYGSRYLPDSELSTGAVGATVIDLIADQTQDLREEGYLTPHFQKLLQSLHEAESEQSDFDAERFIAWYEEPAISLAANKILLEEDRLSPLHEKFVTEFESDLELERRIFVDVLSYKAAIIEGRIAQIITQIKQASQAGEDEKALALYADLTELNSQKQTLSNILGDRPFTPPSHILQQ